MATENKKNKEEALIRALINEFVEAVRVKNVDKIMALHAPNILLFDLAPPLQYGGADAYRKNWEEWFPTIEGPVGFEVHDLKITVGDGVAFSHSLNRLSGLKKNEVKFDLWVRATIGFEIVDGKWVSTHEHISVPFYMDGSFRAAVDLKP